MFVNTDGLLYIVKDGRELPRMLTKEEEIKFGGTIREIGQSGEVKTRKEGGREKVKEKEKGVTITVVGS